MSKELIRLFLLIWIMNIFFASQRTVSSSLGSIKFLKSRKPFCLYCCLSIMVSLTNHGIAKARPAESVSVIKDISLVFIVDNVRVSYHFRIPAFLGQLQSGQLISSFPRQIVPGLGITYVVTLFSIARSEEHTSELQSPMYLV